ncbi:MAG: hypothetical protein M1829_004222 [Trizodia sp. TS-e1964]|nr:MAG: hypothetical protein M1829_004222 [Trizodia sp. TS-e1964]
MAYISESHSVVRETRPKSRGKEKDREARTRRPRRSQLDASSERKDGAKADEENQRAESRAAASRLNQGPVAPLAPVRRAADAAAARPVESSRVREAPIGSVGRAKRPRSPATGNAEESVWRSSSVRRESITGKSRVQSRSLKTARSPQETNPAAKSLLQLQRRATTRTVREAAKPASTAASSTTKLAGSKDASNNGNASKSKISFFDALLGAGAARPPPKMVECLTCMSEISEVKASKLSCGHRMCRDCLKRIFNMSITDPQHMPPRCCTQEHIPLKHVDRLFDDKFKIKWNKKFQEYTTKNRMYCPMRGCGEWIKPANIQIDTSGGRHTGRKFGKCSRCKTKVCCKCNGKWHAGKDCPNDEETAKFVEVAKEKGWKRCHNCSAMIELQEGCNHMTCRCKAEFCMICGLKWKTCNCPWFNYGQTAEDDQLNHWNVPRAIPGRQRPHLANAALRPPQEYQEELERRRNQEQADEAFARRLQALGTDDDDGGVGIEMLLGLRPARARPAFAHQNAQGNLDQARVAASVGMRGRTTLPNVTGRRLSWRELLAETRPLNDIDILLSPVTTSPTVQREASQRTRPRRTVAAATAQRMSDWRFPLEPEQDPWDDGLNLNDAQRLGALAGLRTDDGTNIVGEGARVGSWLRNRLRGAIDSRIAEEQARQRQGNSRSRSSSTARKPTRRTDSPASRQSIGLAGENGAGSLDPVEFDADLLPKDEDEADRSKIQPPLNEVDIPRGQDLVGADGENKNEKTEVGKAPLAWVELPTEVRVRLRKLDKLEPRYQELLRSYRIAHSRVQLIEPFEMSLRENTPLTSISDPSALVEYLNQTNLKGDMVMEELKRVSTEKATLQLKLDEATSTAAKALEEVLELRSLLASADNQDPPLEPKKDIPASKEPLKAEPTVAGKPSPVSTLLGAVMIPPKVNTEEQPPTAEKVEELFSYENEVPHLKAEVTELKAQTDTLKAENKTLANNLEVAKESTESMAQDLENATRELHLLRERSAQPSQGQSLQIQQELDILKSKLQQEDDKTDQLMASNLELEQINVNLRERILELEYEIRSLHLGQVTREKRMAVLTSLIDSLQDQLKAAEEKIANSTSAIESPQTSALDLSAEKDDAVPAPKKKNKKKKKKSGKGATSVEDAAHEPEILQNGETTIDATQKSPDEKFDETMPMPKQIEEPKVRGVEIINEEDEIRKLREKLRGEETLREEIENLRDALINLGQEHIEAKDAIREMTAQKEGVEQLCAKLKVEVTNLTNNQSNAKKADGMQNGGALQSEEFKIKLSKLQTDLTASQKLAATRLKELTDLREALQTTQNELVILRKEMESLKCAKQEHIGAKDTIGEITVQKEGLEQLCAELNVEIINLTNNNAKEAEIMQKRGASQSEEFKIKLSELKTDLTASQKLAAARFKDLTDLREALQKAQHELVMLRKEVESLKSAKQDLSAKTVEVAKLEAKERDLRREISTLKLNLSNRESEVESATHQLREEAANRIREQELKQTAQRELRRLEAEITNATKSQEKNEKDLQKAREEGKTFLSKIRELEDQVANLGRECATLKEGLDLKTAQYQSAESLVNGMRTQTSEISMQMKESRERCESLEEELGDAHRLLSERSREGETMRRLLADVEARAELRVREMKERLDIATEERDRAEDEASLIGRRKSREIEDLKSKLRDVEKGYKQALEDKLELEQAEKDRARSKAELELRVEKAAQEVLEVRRAMCELRDALDHGEKQIRDLEKENIDLHRSAESAHQRIEKLQKSQKTMTNDFKGISNAKAKLIEAENQSSRTSIESSVVEKKGKAPSTLGSDGDWGTTVDTLYVKTILLQFLEQKDKKHRLQLIPVLAKLLHFDKNDEQRWSAAAISL